MSLSTPPRPRHHQNPCPAAPTALRGRKATAKARGGCCGARTCAADRPVAKALGSCGGPIRGTADGAAAKAAGGHRLAIAPTGDRPVAELARRETLAIRAAGDPTAAEARGRIGFAFRGTGDVAITELAGRCVAPDARNDHRGGAPILPQRRTGQDQIDAKAKAKASHIPIQPHFGPPASRRRL